MREIVAALKEKFAITRRRVIGTSIILAIIILSPILGRVAPVAFDDAKFGLAAHAVIYVIAGLALNLLMGYAGQVSLGHAAFIGVGAFTTGYMTWWLGLAFIYALITSAVFGALLAFLVGLPALRIRGLYLAVATLAFGVIMKDVVFQLEFLTGGQGGTTVRRPLLEELGLDFILNADYFVFCFVILLGVWLFDWFITSSKVGRGFLAIREDEDVAASFGVDVARYKLLAFVLSGAIAGIAGSLFGSLSFITQHEQFTFSFSLSFLIMVVVGGLGSRPGVATAAAFFAVFSRLFPGLEEYVGIIGAALLIFTMARHPTGLAQAFLEAREAKKAKAARAGELEEDDLPNVLPSLPAITVSRNGAAPDAPGPVLKAEKISVSFGGLVALDGAGIEVPRGKIVGLIGPNGAGKTTMFNVVSGFIKPNSGTVTFKGEDVTRLAPHQRAGRGMGRTFQLIGLGKNLTVRENFLLAQHTLTTYGIPSALLRLPRVGALEAVLEDRSREAISALGFERFTDTPVRNLSHGQQRLVELGCSLVTSPDLLLLDEPSGGMAPAAAESLAERLIDVRDKLGRTVLLIEHHIPLVLAVCDEIYVLNFGQILSHGTTESITRNPEVVAAYFGETVA